MKKPKRKKYTSKRQIEILEVLSRHPDGCTIFEMKDHINRHVRQRELRYTKLLQDGLVKEIWGKDGVGLRFVISQKGIEALKSHEAHLEEKKRLH